MGLHVHRAERTDVLASALAELLSRPPADPFAGELVVVPAKGVERWLSQRLSHRLGASAAGGDGVCARVDFRSPRSLVAELTATADDDPWAPEALAWPLLDVLDDSLAEPWAQTLARHLGHGLAGDEAELRRGRRFSVARRLAGLFATYAEQRPSLLADWSEDRDTDGAGHPLAGDLAWQPELWRRLVARVDAPSPLERHRSAVGLLRARPDAFDLPERLSLFGHTRLSVTDIDLLAALADSRDVHVWLPHPSPALWSALHARAGAGAVARATDDSQQLVGHPLLSSLGRDTRELQRALAVAPAVTDVHEGSPEPVDTVLGWLQADLAADRGADAPRPAGRSLKVGDRSVQVHACHGVARQVDVLREVLLGLLADDPTLEPRDVLVMCPDIDTYAPLIEAGFGLGEVVGDAAGGGGHPAHRLRVRLADRSPVQTNPLLAVARALLDLAGGRAPATQVLDLARAEPVRRRFAFSDDDLEQLDTWARESGVRWAFDAEHRADFGLSSYVANTWEFGLDRLLTGVALSDDSSAWLDRALPLDDVGSAQVDLVGRLAEYVARLRAAADRLTGTQPLSRWLAALDDGVGSLTAVATADGWQPGQVQRELGRIRRAAAGLETVELRLPDVRALLSDRLAGRPTRANFRTGTLTVCTMVPMRSVPHRVVCLLGLDDGVFPRQGSVDGDDALARDPLTGERDPRSEDRQLLLDAILAATRTLVITYTGANELSGRERPPAVPLKELLDALDLTARSADGSPVSAAVTVRHPLQPFDARNVTPGRLVVGETFSFDAAAAAGARAASRPRREPPAFLDAPLAPRAAVDVPLAELVRFWTDPVKGFLLRDGVDIALPADEDQPEDALPVEIDSLKQWAVGDRVLNDLLAGFDPAIVKQREWRRGELPPGQLGWRMLGQIIERAGPLRDAAAALRASPARAVDVAIELGEGRRVVGTVPEAYGDRLVPVTYSRLGAKHRIASWVRLLALAAFDGDHNWTATTIGRPHSRSRGAVATSLLGPLDHSALDVLRDLVALRDRGLRAPLPLPLKASLGYARARRTHADVADALLKAGYDWRDSKFPGEQSDPAALKIWGLLDEPPDVRAAPGDGEGFAGETGRFGALAMRVWSPLVAAEQGSW
ncbi:MAG TPA: exodeoxyribonuclease V subunit gamma [Nocardioides sp.]|uniref:exodeoxyribonuclease V subunit gamma n=1 Tax=Nocardioides sp. TaxID=35761 RepID=UPI002E319516|nr:exodeoxyribonuclease V subunit gamma [Nocardioides sp.]HEX3929821.1 exodeoxyribonuclease V subunit gamma [Nocardioides sp.]